uniref:Uncharacterized protein n=1 Tax=Oryza punctata TaxID=4537 RepID=A0A0E0LPF3_ORYPU
MAAAPTLLPARARHGRRRREGGMDDVGGFGWAGKLMEGWRWRGDAKQPRLFSGREHRELRRGGGGGGGVGVRFDSGLRLGLEAVGARMHRPIVIARL